METDQRIPVREDNTYQEHKADQGSSPATENAGMDRDRNAGGQAPKRSFLQRPGGKFALGCAGLICVVAAGAYGFDWWTHGRFVQSTDDAYLQADKVAVSTRIASTVEKVLVADNAAVSKGDLLVQLDPRQPQAQLDQAMASADVARASIKQAEAEIQQQEAQIAQAQAQLDSAQSQSRFADREASRYAKLVAAGAESNERYDQMRQNRDQARTQVAQATAAVSAAQRRIATLRAQAAEGQAQVEQAMAQAAQANVDLDATQVRAGIDGRIGDRTVQVGQYIQPGNRMMSIVPVHQMYLVANFKETQIHRMHPGQPVTISVDALDGQDVHGVIDSFSPGTGAQFALIPPSNATGNFTKIVQRVPVRIRLQDDALKNPLLVPGLSVVASVDTAALEVDVTRHHYSGNLPRPGGFAQLSAPQDRD